ncbi:MAG TPA: 8-amino-7-oxononanoate synthase [Fibrobacteraceae bacterium]|nr:8-amino-7-oxononanoate synthase [Fibrobacteraceae bacterium]
MKDSRYSKILQSLHESSQLRFLREMSQKHGSRLEFEGKKYINLSSNDYLGLAFDSSLLTEFYKSLSKETVVNSYGLGASSSRLHTGNSPLYTQVEKKLASLYSKEAALIFNSGYHANIGILPALSSKKDLILSDKLNHASLIDGFKLGDATLVRYRHFDYEQLEEILTLRCQEFDHVFIVTESIFSMDGDIANLKRLVEIKNKFNAFLYVDEAHAFGCRGEHGLGICEEQGVTSEVDFIVGTFGKAIGSQGAYIVCSQITRDYLINTMRSLIFTTGLPPVTLSWLLFILERLGEFKEKRAHLLSLSKLIRGYLQSNGKTTVSESHIIPIILGENKEALLAAQKWQENGFLVFPIRPPTVPMGTARLRLSLTADMDESVLKPLQSLIP